MQFDRPKLEKFKKTLKEANTETFIFEGNEYNSSYAKYLVEHLENELDDEFSVIKDKRSATIEENDLLPRIMAIKSVEKIINNPDKIIVTELDIDGIITPVVCLRDADYTLAPLMLGITDASILDTFTNINNEITKEK